VIDSSDEAPRHSPTRVIMLSLLLAACGPPQRTQYADAHPADSDNTVDAECRTSISGKVFAPNGTLPLYNVAIYVPLSTPPPITEGVSCQQCMKDFPGHAIVSTFSDSSGAFLLEGVPPGADVPIVLSVGKWRRQLTIPLVAACQDTTIPDGLFRLPRNRAEGDMPRIAMVTGGCDPLGCLLWKLGIDAGEFGSSSAGPTRVVFYDGHAGSSPGEARPAPELWDDIDELKKFDVVINSCECNVHNELKLQPSVLRRYADIGGRVFASHFHYTWGLTLVPEWRNVAEWTEKPTPGLAPNLVATEHPKGAALAGWLLAVGASPSYGQLPLANISYNVGSVSPPTLRWLYSSNEATTHYLSFKTPVGLPVDKQCGKVVYAGMHVSSGAVNDAFPSSCTAELSPAEKALVFLLFDLTSCVDPVVR
jgi:hypothetical protein